MNSVLNWPSKKPGYYVYKPLQKGTQKSARKREKVTNKLQLLYYKYLLHTGLYMLSAREQATINTIVLVCVALSVYWLASLFI